MTCAIGVGVGTAPGSPVSAFEGDAPTPGGRKRNSCNPSFTSWPLPTASASVTQVTVSPSISCLARRRRRPRSIMVCLQQERGASLFGQLTYERHETGGKDSKQHDRDHGAHDSGCSRPPGGAPPPADERHSQEGQRRAYRNGVQEDGRQAEQQEEVEQNRGPDDVRDSLDRLPVPAQPALSLAVGSDDDRDEQQGRQRSREKEGVATNASQHRAGERVAGRDRGERDVLTAVANIAMP